MILQGRGISPGEAEGEAVKLDERVSFLGDVDLERGKVFDEEKIADSIFVFPGGKGSTVGSYVIYQLKDNRTAPLGIINKRSETTVASGAILSDIPLVDEIDIELIEPGDEVRIDGDSGEVELKGVELQPVVTAFLKRDDRILLLKRSEKVGSYEGKWAGVSGYLERSDPAEHARMEIREETGLDAVCVSKGEPVRVRYEGKKKIWEVNPFLFEVKKEPELNWESTEYRWVRPEGIKDMETVPKLWQAYLSARCEDESEEGR
ncbi:MAG: aconitase X swivel domain-containing protein [Candidatus Natronoplasma sp.]